MKKMKHILVISLGVIILAMPTGAHAGILEFLFPSWRDSGPDPAETLQAPFAVKDTDGLAAPEIKGLPENAIPLDKPHRASSEISKWLVTASSEAMTFQTNNFVAEIEERKKNFDSFGQQSYEEFLGEHKISNVVNSGKYKVSSFVEDLPLLLNEGPVEGRYRWLFEVPVMISYMDSGAQNYKNADPVNQNMVLTVQVGRSLDAENQDGILIERWSGKLNKKR